MLRNVHTDWGSHLLEKLRSLGAEARLAEEKKIGGRVVPQPIKRRLVV